MSYGLMDTTFTCMIVVSSTPMRPTIGGVVPVTVSCLNYCLPLTSAVVSIVCVHAFYCGSEEFDGSL